MINQSSLERDKTKQKVTLFTLVMSWYSDKTNFKPVGSI